MANITGYQTDSQGIYIVKDPTANVIYTVDWSEYLATGDTLSSATITIQDVDGDITALQHPTDAGTDVAIIDSNKVAFRLSGGSAGFVYNIACSVITTDGDTDTRHFRVIVKDNRLS